MSKNINVTDKTIIFLFFLIPTTMLIIGYFIFPYPPSTLAQQLVYIPLFLGLILLGIGFLWKEKMIGAKIKISGWLVFSFFWATSPSYLYLSEGGDIFNASVCIVGVYILIYIAYHEWLSLQKNEYIPCLNWIAGGSFIAGIIYFTIDSGIIPELKNLLINTVAEHSILLMNLFGAQATRHGSIIIYGGAPITIIFACTAIQSMVLFVGMNGSINKVNVKRKILAISATIIPIYFLNLIRNAAVVFLIGSNITSFNIAHNVIGKTGSLIALVGLLFLNFKITPELYNEINCIIGLPKRNGPIEKFFRKIMGKKLK